MASDKTPNPYQSRDADGLPNKVTGNGTKFARPVDYAGGTTGVLLISLAGGVFTALGLLVFLNGLNAVPVFAIPFIGILGALIAVAMCLRNTTAETSHRLIFAALLSVPAYIVFVPVCTLAGTVSAGVFGSGPSYMPSPVGVGLATTVSFGLVLFLTAASLRAVFRRRFQDQSKPAETLNHLADRS